MEGIEINSVVFLRTVYNCVSGNNNQAAFILRFFSIAGCKKYKYPEKGPVKNEDYGGPRHWITDRPINDEIRSTFKKPIKKSDLFTYIRNNLKSDEVRTAMNAFEFPADISINEDAFIWAIVEQFDAFITAGADEAQIVYQDYKRFCQLSNKEIVELNAQPAPRYNGDSYMNNSQMDERNHIVNCYSDFVHTWTIRNTGRLTWSNRRLVLLNQHKKGPRTTMTAIEIPETDAGEEIKITASYNARSFEGKFVSEWIMCDEEGENCFPNKTDLNFKISVHYTIKKAEETQ